MIKFITVWVLTVGYFEYDYQQKGGPATYQLQYATQSICEKQIKNHATNDRGSKTKFWARCDFQQIPVYAGEKK